MAGEKRAGQDGRRNNRPLRYFYLNGLLHRKLVINRPADTITTWCYPTGKRVAYAYSDVKKNKRPAFSTKQAAALLNRNKITLERALEAGAIEYPQHTYGLNEHKKKYAYMWSEDDILAAHAYFLTVHYGRPRKDGIINSKPMPTVRELKALMRNEEILYIKDGEEYKPVWLAN